MAAGDLLRSLMSKLAVMLEFGSKPDMALKFGLKSIM